MQKSIRASIVAFAFLALTSPAWASRDGVDFVPGVDLIVFGGSYLWQRTQNPADARALYTERLDDRMRSTLYRAQGVLSEIKASPKGEYVAVLERIWEENVGRDRANYTDRRVGQNGEIQEFYYFEESRLNILDLQGRVIETLRGARRFVWDPTGSRLAYITGEYYEGGPGFTPTGTWIYELASKQAQRIYSGGLAVEWAGWDGNLYIYDPFNGDAPQARVYRFDPEVRQVVPTSHKGIFFSPGGTYYYAEEEGAAVRVFRTDTDRELPLELPDQAREELVPYSAAGWLGNETLIIPSPDSGDPGDFLLDVNTGTARHAGGTVTRMGSSTDRVLVLQGGSFTARGLSELPRIQ